MVFAVSFSLSFLYSLVLLESRRYCVLSPYSIGAADLPILRCFGHLVIAAVEDCLRDCGDHRI